MTDLVTPARLRFERVLAAPVDTVWQYLVDPELRARWFMGGAIDPRAGGDIEMIFDHGRLSDTEVPMPDRFAGAVGKRWTERIIAVDPPHRIVFEWQGGKAGTVTITLTGEGDRTRLVLDHDGLRGPNDARNYGGGWHAHLAVLEARIAGQGVPDFWALHAASEARAATMLAGG